MLAIVEKTETRPIILADSGDNPTGGGVGDRADVLKALIARNFDGAVIGGITDRPAVEACFAAGEGRKLTLRSAARSIRQVLPLRRMSKSSGGRSGVGSGPAGCGEDRGHHPDPGRQAAPYHNIAISPAMASTPKTVRCWW